MLNLPLSSIWEISIPTPLALAAIAVIGYLFGRRNRGRNQADADQARRELKKAQAVALRLETIAAGIRESLSDHQNSIVKFKDRVGDLSSNREAAVCQELCAEAEEMLQPTLRLATSISSAYDEIRQQLNHLMTFTEVRTDPLTRVANRRGLDETLDNLVAMHKRYGHEFSVVLFDIDHFKQVNDRLGHLEGDRALQAVARAIDNSVRDTDIVARYGGEEFVVAMPHTDLASAAIYAGNLRRIVAETLEMTVSAGVAEAIAGDTPQTLLARADAALYSAKAAGRDRVHCHLGEAIEPLVEAPVLTAAASA